MVIVYGVITAIFKNGKNGATWAFMQNGTENRGGLMMYSPDWIGEQVQRGDKVMAYGEMSEYDDATQIKNANVVKLSSGHTVPPLELTTADLLDVVKTEEYEGMLITLKNVKVVVANPDAEKNKNYGESIVTDPAGGEVIIDQNVYHDKGHLDDDMPVGSTMQSVTGVLHFHYKKFKLLIPAPEDIVGFVKANVEATTTRDPLAGAVKMTMQQLNEPHPDKKGKENDKTADDSQHLGKAVTVEATVVATLGGDEKKTTWTFLQARENRSSPPLPRVVLFPSMR